MPGSLLAIWRPSPGAGGYEGELDEKLRQNNDPSEIHQPPEAEKLAEEVPTRCRRLTHRRPSVHDTGRSAERKVRRFVGGVKGHGGDQSHSE